MICAGLPYVPHQEKVTSIRKVKKRPVRTFFHIHLISVFCLFDIGRILPAPILVVLNISIN